jgi:hypothetical protein
VVGELNKLTHDTKQVQIPLLMNMLQEDNVDEYSEIMFQILSNNNFYSELYSSFFLQLVTVWPVFNVQLSKKYDTYVESLSRIVVGNSDQYDEYCEYKKINTELKTFSLFLFNVRMEYPDYYANAVNTLCTLIDQGLQHGNKDSMNEWVDHLLVLASSHPSFPISTLQIYSTLDVKKTPGVNHKFIFKCLDILKKVE